ncbi:MAG: hypothetical protein Q9221_001650 [Calogaya cf. arnoldii]
MTRKRKPPKQTKRLEVTGPDGWTRITKGLKNVHLKTSPRLANQPPEIPPNQTLADLEKTHARYRTQWLSSPCYQDIQKLFLDGIIPALTSSGKSNGKIDRCVMLGLGSLSNGQRSSWWELVFLESVLSLLFPSSSSSSSPSALSISSPSSQDTNSSDSNHHPLGANGTPISSNENPTAAAAAAAAAADEPTLESDLNPPPTPKTPIYIQDPIFNPQDISYLQSTLGYTVLQHPSAFSHLTPSTFLFAPHLEIELYARALSGGPQLCVATDVTECIDQLMRTLGGKEKDEEVEEKRRQDEELFRGYRDAMASERLPGFERDDWMCFTRVYWTTPPEKKDLEV